MQCNRFRLRRWQYLLGVVVLFLCGSASASSEPGAATNTTLAWQRTDRYVPPDPNGFFPDDPEGGKKLDVLYQVVDKDRRSDEEVLSTVRRGFRRTTQDRASILAWIGSRYIWRANSQNPQAVEILYHAVPLEEHNAVYYGLSVLRNKPANVLRTLADLCLQSKGADIGRILWGLGPQREELIPYLSPYLQDKNAARRELAGALVRSCKGELDFDQWQRQKRQEQFKGPSANQMQQIRQALLTGDSKARFQALITLMHSGGPKWDNSLLPAMQAAATDPDRRVRNEVARLAGNRWVWAAEKQDPNAIALMVQLGGDRDRDVRYQAVYYGLSVVRDKSEPVVQRLVELALTDHENGLYGRIVWGLRGFSKDTPGLVGRVLAEQLGRAKTDVHYAASVYGLYRDVLGKEPPADWGLAHVPQQYPEDLFVLPLSAREPFQPESLDALWDEFARALPTGISADRLPLWDTNAKHICYARIRGKEQAETVKNAVGNHPRLRAGELRPLPLATQLYLEEKHSVGPAGGGKREGKRVRR